MAKFQQFLSKIGSNRDRAALRGIFSQFLTDDDPPALKDLVLASIILSGAETTQVTISGASTTGILISGAASADGISITSICADAIHISGANTASGLHISGNQVVGTLFEATAAAEAAHRVTVPTGITLDAGIDINATSTGVVTSGLTMQGTGTFTTGITLSATAITTGITISAGSMTDAIKISGTTPVDGIEISSACSTAAINLSGASAIGVLVAGATTTGVSITGACTTAIKIARATAKTAIRVGEWAASQAAGSAVVFATNMAGVDTSQLNIVAAFGESTSDLTGAYSTSVLRGRHLVSAAADTVFTHEVYGVMGQVICKNASFNHYASGIMGTFEASNTLTHVMSGYVAAAVTGRLGGAVLTSESGAIVAGVAAINNSTAHTATGIIAGFATHKTAAGIAWPIGLYMGVGSATTPIQIGAKSNTAGSGITIPSTDDWGAVRVFTDDNNANIADSVRGIQSRTLLTTAQSAGTIRALQGQLKAIDGVNFATGVYTAVQGYIELVGSQTVASSAVLSCFDASIEIGTALTATGYVAGFKAELTGSGTCAAGLDCGFLVTNASGAAVWTYGMYVEASAVDTGIYIGACTTGITINTCTTQALSANVTAVAGGLTGSAVSVYAAATAGTQDVGIAAYLDATFGGQSTGNWTYGAGIWLNLLDTYIASAGGWAGHEQLTPLNVGIYSPVNANMADADVIYGIKAEGIYDTKTNGCYFAALNVKLADPATRTAIFFAHNSQSVNLGATKSGAAGGSIALVDINGTMHYVNTYTS